MGATQEEEQRQYPRFGLGLPVTLIFGERRQSIPGELQDISCGGCFFKSRVAVDVDRRISVILADSSGHTCRASGRVVRTLAYKGFAVLFDDEGSRAMGDFIKGFAPLTQAARVARLSTELMPEIQIL
jgi:PilZ domain-containing protein